MKKENHKPNKPSDKLSINTNLQLSLDVFKDLDAEGVKIERSKKEIGFRKNNLLITVSNLNLDQRRILDVVFFIAAQNIDLNSPHKEYVSKNTDGLHEVDLSFFKWLLSFSNPRNSRLKDVMSSVQNAKIQAEELSAPSDASYNSKDKLKRWQTHNFFGSAFIDVPEQKAAFSINPIFERYIQNPKNFHFLSLRYVLPNLSSKILYDWLVRADSFDAPLILTTEELLHALGQEEKKSYQQFGAFNRAFLTPAIEGVNETTDLHVELITHRKSDVVSLITHVELRVTRQERTNKEDEILHVVSQYKSLREDFGLQNAQIEEILRNRDEWTDERIEHAKHYTLLRLQKGGVKSVAAYFMNALREGYVVGKLELEMLRGERAHLESLITDSPNQHPQSESNNKPTQAPEPLTASSSPIASIDDKLTYSRLGWAHFNALPADEQLALIDAFCADAYITFVAKAENINAAEKGAMVEAIYSNKRLHVDFGYFIHKSDHRASEENKTR